MGAEFKELDDGVHFLINNEELCFYSKEEDLLISRDDFELDDDELYELLKLKVKEFPHSFDYYHRNFLINPLLYTNIQFDLTSQIIAIMSEIDIGQWNNPFIIADFLDCYFDLLSKYNFRIQVNKSFDWGITLFINLNAIEENSILPTFEEAIDLLDDNFDKAMGIMHLKVQPDILTKFFDFPSEYKTICSQYLIWFGNFLKNLGIEAKVSTEDKNGQTALIVTPDKNTQLLKEIEQLFYRYIDLPYMDYIPYNSESMNPHQKYQMDSLLDEIGDYQHKLKKAMRHQRLLEAENDALIEDKIKLKTTVKELEKDKLLLKSSLKDPKKNEFFSCFNKSFSIVGSVDNKNELTVGLGLEIKPKGMLKEMFKKSDNAVDNKKENTEEPTE